MGNGMRLCKIQVYRLTGDESSPSPYRRRDFQFVYALKSSILEPICCLGNYIELDSYIRANLMEFIKPLMYRAIRREGVVVTPKICPAFTDLDVPTRLQVLKASSE